MGLFFQTLRAVLGATVADFLYTPIWWYTRGLFKQLKGIAVSLGVRQEALAIDIWLKNLFVPMYGQYDLTGRLISFFMRLFQIIVRSIAFIIWAALLLIWLLAWILIPVGVVYLVIVQVKNFL
ncbi:MAG: hypothetical protein Q7S48_03830 [bacterium]|nr:hypothetical protein [bacterium]